MEKSSLSGVVHYTLWEPGGYCANDVSCRSTGWKPVVTANGLMHYATYEPIGMVLGMLTLGRRRTTKDSVLWLVGVHLGETTI
jgi:hypothetical protein